MPAHTPEEWRLSELNQSIERLQEETAQLEVELADIANQLRRARRQSRYLRLARQLRAPAGSLALWPLGVLAVGPLMLGFVLLLLFDLLFGSLPLAIMGLLTGFAMGGVLLAMLLFRPSDLDLPAALNETTAAVRLGDVQLREIVDRLATAKARQRDLIEQRRELMASGRVQRAALLQRPWKAMAEVEWQDFVVEVCRTLGAAVDRAPPSREKDANLLADFGDRRVAIVTGGEGHTLNSTAVQNALAGQKQHGCSHCAVIVNRRLTGAAQDFARHNGCKAIGVEEFPDFVMGKLKI